jgi:hypothetical protein
MERKKEEHIDVETETDESGYSERQTDLDIEIRAGEWQSLNRFRSYQKRSRQGKIIATYQAVSNRLNQLVSMYYSFVNKNPKEAEKMLTELRKLRLLQEILLNCMVWEPKGELNKDMIPQELWDLIE